MTDYQAEISRRRADITRLQTEIDRLEHEKRHSPVPCDSDGRPLAITCTVCKRNTAATRATEQPARVDIGGQAQTAWLKTHYYAHLSQGDILCAGCHRQRQDYLEASWQSREGGC